MVVRYQAAIKLFGFSNDLRECYGFVEPVLLMDTQSFHIFHTGYSRLFMRYVGNISHQLLSSLVITYMEEWNINTCKAALLEFETSKKILKPNGSGNVFIV